MSKRKADHMSSWELGGNFSPTCTRKSLSILVLACLLTGILGALMGAVKQQLSQENVFFQLSSEVEVIAQAGAVCECNNTSLLGAGSNAPASETIPEPLPLSTIPSLAVSTLPLSTAANRTLPPTRIISRRDYAFMSLQNVCYVPRNRTLILLGTANEIMEAVRESRNASAYKSAAVWETLTAVESNSTQICKHCLPYVTSEGTPETYRWISGKTTALTFNDNAGHMWCDKLWPLSFSQVPPASKMGVNNPDHYLLFNLPTDPAALALWQTVGMIAINPKADVLGFSSPEPGEEDVVCLERLTVVCLSCYRHYWKDLEANKKAVMEYRGALSRVTGTPTSVRRSPPHKLRVAVYARMDKRRRRILNGQHIIETLSLHPCNCMEVTSVDLLLTHSPPGKLTPLEHIRLFSESDLVVASHGPFLSFAMMMPLQGAVIEIMGPCPAYNWFAAPIHGIGNIQDLSNPVGLALPSLVAGNTTDCRNMKETPDFTVDINKLRVAVDSLLTTWGYMLAPSQA